MLLPMVPTLSTVMLTVMLTVVLAVMLAVMLTVLCMLTLIVSRHRRRMPRQPRGRMEHESGDPRWVRDRIVRGDKASGRVGDELHAVDGEGLAPLVQ